MIGIFDYTVWLTYMSLLSAWVGVFLSLGCGRLYAGMLCLMFSGFCDAFDGRVARMKKDRTEEAKGFGIQIDSLTDIVAFGLLPACLGICELKYTGKLEEWGFAAAAVCAVYVLAAMIRLAYYNVHEEERQKKENGAAHSYIGLPVTAACLVFPTVLLIQHLTGSDLAAVYFAVMIVTAFAFVLRFSVAKPGLRGILIMVGIGFVELVLFIIRHMIR